MNESEEVLNFDDKRLSLIDVSFEDDALYSSPSRDSQSQCFPDNSAEKKSVLEAADTSNVEASLVTLEEGEDEPELEMPKRNGKYNLRKSLAWDSAFFTSAGVLEPEELSSMIAVEKTNKQKLPGIEEDVYRSTDSISTLASDNLTLETLEADLFSDIRASIQKSSKASNMGNSSGEAGSGLPESETETFEKKNSTHSKLKAKVLVKRPNAIMQGSDKITKKSSVCPPGSKAVGVNGDTNSLCKPPKATSCILTIPAKRASLGANRLKVENDSSKTSMGREAKVPALKGTRNTVSRPLVSCRSSLSSSVASKAELTTSSVDSTGSLSSDNSSKSSLNSVRRKVDHKTGNRSSVGSTSITTVRNAAGKKTQPRSSRLSPNLKSLTKLSSGTSPASSISEWSSESLSPTSTLNKRSNSLRSSIDTNSCRDTFGDGTTPQDNGKLSTGDGAQVGSVGACAKRVSTGGTALLYSDSVKPTGLRMPSPKIGFFDGGKSAVRTPNGSIKSHPAVPIGLPRGGAGTVSPSGQSNDAKSAKLRPTRTLTTVRAVKANAQPPGIGIKPKFPLPVQEPSNTALKDAGASRNGKCYPGKSLTAQNRMSPASCSGKNLKGGKIVSPNGNTSKNRPDCGEKKLSVSKCVEGTEINCPSGSPDTTKVMGSISKNLILPQKAGEDGLHGENYLKNDMHFYDTHECEKTCSRDQADSLTEQVGTLSLKSEIQKESFGDPLPIGEVNVSREVDAGMDEKLF